MAVTEEPKRGEDIFEKYVMGLVRVVVLVLFGGGFGFQLAVVVLDRFWPGRALRLEYAGGLLGIVAAYYLYRLLRDWKGLWGMLEK